MQYLNEKGGAMVKGTGTVCLVCKLGELIQNSYQDYHCNVCGLKYKFLPAETLVSPESDDFIIQVQPGLYVVRKSTSIFSKGR